MPEIGPKINFDAGIEQIVSRTETQSASLPEVGQYVPSEGLYEQQLLEVLFPPSIEQSLVESFRPLVRDLSILTPPGNQAALEESLIELKDMMKKHEGSPIAERIESALEVLGEESEMRALLATYRHLLHQA